MGMVERGGALKGFVVPDAKKATLLPMVVKYVTPGATINTDELASYKTLPSLGYGHFAVHHAAGQYVDGLNHTNSVEGFWAHLKLGIKSTHVSISKKWAQNYVDEFSFRYNNRGAPADMFRRMLAQISNPGRR